MTTSSVPSTTPSQSNSNGPFFGCLGSLAVLIAVGVGWIIYSSQPQGKQYLPADQLELTTTAVPLSRQVLLLVDDYANSPSFDLVWNEITPLVSSLKEDQEVCIFQVMSDQPVMRVDPWCSNQIKKSWWVMPEVKPPPYANEAEEAAYVRAKADLDSELVSNQLRAETTWAAEQAKRGVQVNTLLLQLPMQLYRCLDTSLARLMEVRRPTGNQPTEVVIYSSMQDVRYFQMEPETVSLAGAEVKVRVMTSEGESGLQQAQAKWGAWFTAAHPAKLEWSLMEIPSVVSVQAPKVGSSSPRTPSVLPPVVPKPPGEDVTSLIKGGVVSGDATSVVR